MMPTHSLVGQFLLAMPGMGDPRFEHSVIAICAHDDAGAFGLCLHEQAEGLTVPELMRQLNIDPGQTPDIPVLQGGPVESDRGFVLHSPDWRGADTRQVAGRWAITGTRDVLVAIAEGRGPSRWLATVGYAGWGAQQLDSELSLHGWFATPATMDLIWDTKYGNRWRRGFAISGIDASQISFAAGNA